MSCIRPEATVVDWAEPLPSILRRRLASQQPKLPVEGGGWRAREALTEMTAMEAQERARVAIILCYMPSACGNRNYCVLFVLFCWFCFCFVLCFCFVFARSERIY